MSVKIAVIGAGAVGLSTAINIQELIPGSRVTIAADKFYDCTTSYGCGGMFIPAYEHGLARNDVHLLRKWMTTSWKFYSKLAGSMEAEKSGAMFMNGYDLMNQLSSSEALLYNHVLPCAEMSEDEKRTLGFHNFKHGFKLTTVVFNMVKYLKWLTKRFEENGGKFVRMHLKSFHELIGQYDMIVNCSGYGSTLLADDNKMVPVSGHLVRVRAPWIKHFVLTEEQSYMIPGEEIVNLGSINQTGNTDLTIKPEHTSKIIKRCEKLFPNLKGAKIDHEWTGVRPVRETIRLEIEMVKFGNNRIPILHNYGHGHHGVGLSWGTAVHAAEMASSFLLRNKSHL